jgi:protein SCO1/2
MRAETIAVAATLALGAGAARAAPAGSPWGAAYFPNVPLVTQDGRTVRFYDDLVKDRLVVVNFIFTRCTASCPLETAKLADVQKRLGTRVGRDIFIYSITLDPEHDTPAALKAYAEKFHAGPGWLFLTGKREDIDRLRAKLGDRSKWQTHATGLSIGNDPAGQWTTLSAVDDPGFLAANIEGWMRTKGTDAPPVKSYAEAPRIHLAPGENLFRTRCAACHTIGEGRSIGPDLAGVTARRDRAWLARWIRDPQEMLRERDPLATELYARNQRVAMPSIQVSDKDVADLMAYLESRSRAAPKRDREAAASR